MEKIREYNDRHNALMRQWREKYPGYAYFTEDGVINPEEWFNLPGRKRIVFLLKEAYSKEKRPADWNEAKWLNGAPCREGCPHNNCAERCRVSGNSFNRLAEWTYFITELSDRCAAMPVCDDELLNHIYWLGVYDKNDSRRDNNAAYYKKRAALLKKLAIVNLKKANGEKRSHRKSLKENVETAGELLIKQLELIRPHYLICCGTWQYLDEGIQSKLEKTYKVIKTSHPNARISRRELLIPILEYSHNEAVD